MKEPANNPWLFNSDANITLVCAELPVDRRPIYADRHNYNYVSLSAFADLDSLVEIYGHIRALNPASTVTIRSAHNLATDDLNGHIVLIGGIIWNSAASWFEQLVNLPVKQLVHDGDVFQATLETGEERRFSPNLIDGSDGAIGTDVGLFARTHNPYSPAHTITFCNGVTVHGVRGVIRCFTEPALSASNTDALATRLPTTPFCALIQVEVFNSEAAVPDLHRDSVVLFATSPASSLEQTVELRQTPSSQ